MLYLRIRQSVAQPYRRRPPVPCGHPRYAGRRGIARRPRHAYPVRLGRERPAALAFPVFCRRVLSTCGAPTRGLRLFASYVMAHALYLRGEYGRSLGMAENALIMKQGSYPISELFLHLAASMACMSLKDTTPQKRILEPLGTLRAPTALSSSLASTTAFCRGSSSMPKNAIP